MAGLVPAISIRMALRCVPKRDRRDKPGDDEESNFLKPSNQKNANVRISMLSRGRALGGEVGSLKAVCAVQRARPSLSES